MFELHWNSLLSKRWLRVLVQRPKLVLKTAMLWKKKNLLNKCHQWSSNSLLNSATSNQGCIISHQQPPPSLSVSPSPPWLCLRWEEEIWCHACLPSAVRPLTHTSAHAHTDKRYLQYNYFHDSSDASPSLSIIRLLSHVTLYIYIYMENWGIWSTIINPHSAYILEDPTAAIPEKSQVIFSEFWMWKVIKI